MPQEQADIRFSASTPELTQTCQQFGQVYSCPTFSVQQARIWTLEVATVGEQTTAILYAIDGDGKKCEQPLVNTICELVSDAGGPTVKGAVQKKEKNKYTISYQPTHRGRHQLHVKVEKIRTFRRGGSPQGHFNRPSGGVAVDSDGNMLVVDRDNHRIQKFTADGKFLTEVGQKGNKPRV